MLSTVAKMYAHAQINLILIGFGASKKERRIAKSFANMIE